VKRFSDRLRRLLDIPPCVRRTRVRLRCSDPGCGSAL